MSVLIRCENDLESRKLFMIEMQGSVVSKDGKVPDGKTLGRLRKNDRGKYEMIIGNHVLEGTHEVLKQPLLVIEPTEEVDTDAVSQHRSSICQTVGVVRDRIIFKTRPNIVIGALGDDFDTPNPSDIESDESMLARRLCQLSTRQPASPFLRSVSPDHITASANTRTDQPEEPDQIQVLMEELMRERKFVKSLRDENETLRHSLITLEQREQELAQMSDHVRSQSVEIDSYKRKVLESENRMNELKIQLKDFKDAMEVEKVKLNQARTLPIILAGIAGCVGTYLLVRSKIELEKQQFKFLKFELENMWMSRVRDIDSRLDKQLLENERLVSELGKLSATGGSSSHIVSIWGRKIL